jgi:hypothetical protein
MLPGRRTFTQGLGAFLTATSGTIAMGRDKKNKSSPRVTFKLGEPIISDFERERRAEGRRWAKGYSQSELDEAQAKYGLVFPPDLIELFRDRRPVLGYDWRTDDKEIREMLAWPLEGLLFDVESGYLWWPEWGKRPETVEARTQVLTDVVSKAPKLIPLFSHRYLPSEPSLAGNPVLSIYQSDMIYYGANLKDYFERELTGSRRPLPQPIRRIRFWSDFVERNH